MILAITYSRCSTKKQDLETQNKKLLSWSEKFEEQYHFEDIAISGRKNSRKGINTLMDLVNNLDINKYECVKVGVLELSSKEKLLVRNV